MSVRRVRSLTAGATNYFAKSGDPPSPAVARSDSLTRSVVAEGLGAAALPSVPASPSEGGSRTRLASELLESPAIFGSTASVPVGMPTIVPRPRQEWPPVLPVLASARPVPPPVEGSTSAVPGSPRRIAAARAAFSPRGAADPPPAPGGRSDEARDARTTRIAETLRKELNGVALDAIVRECSFYEQNHPGVVPLDVFGKALHRLVPGVGKDDVRHLLASVGLSDVAPVHVKQLPRSYAERKALEAAAAPRRRGEKGVDEKFAQSMDVEGVQYVRFLRRITDPEGLSSDKGPRRGSVVGATLGAQIDSLAARLREQDSLARTVTAAEAHAELSRGNRVAKVVATFNALDVDKDGALSLDELRAGLKAQRLVLSNEEAARFISMIDADANGSVSISEFMGHFAGNMAERKTTHVRPPPAGARGHDNLRSAVFRPAALEALSALLAELPELDEALPRGMGPAALKYFTAIDKDQDGFVSRDELREHLKAQALHNRRWAHDSVSDPVSQRIDAAVDKVVALCDTNGDGFVDVADLAAVASAAKVVPRIPACMPGGVPGGLVAVSHVPLKPSQHDAFDSAAPDPPRAPPSPPPLGAVRSSGGLGGGDAPNHAPRWPPPRAHVVHESIGDIVPFLQPNTTLQEGTWRLPPNVPLRRHVVDRAAPWDVTSARRPLSESGSSRDGRAAGHRYGDDDVGAGGGVSVSSSDGECLLAETLRAHIEPEAAGGAASPKRWPLAGRLTQHPVLSSALRASIVEKNAGGSGADVVPASSGMLPPSALRFREFGDAPLNARAARGSTSGQTSPTRLLSLPPSAASTTPYWLQPTSMITETALGSGHGITEKERLTTVTRSEAAGGLDPLSAAARAEERQRRTVAVTRRKRASYARLLSALQVESDNNERLAARVLVRHRLHDDTQRDTVAAYIQGIVPDDGRTQKRVFARDAQPGYVNHRLSGQHIPFKLAY